MDKSKETEKHETFGKRRVTKFTVMRLANKLYDIGFVVYTNTCFPIVCYGAHLPVRSL